MGHFASNVHRNMAFWGYRIEIGKKSEKGHRSPWRAHSSEDGSTEAKVIPIAMRTAPANPASDRHSPRIKKEAIAVKTGSVQKASETKVAETLRRAMFCRI